MSTTTGGRRVPLVAPRPTGAGRIGVVGPVLAVLLVALGAFLGREALAGAGIVGWRPWLPPVLDGLDGFAPQTWLVAAGAALALLGLWLVAVALGRRRRRTLDLTSRTGVHVRTRDVARLAAGAARDVDGVLAATARATRRRVRVRVDALAESGVREAVTAAVGERLGVLATPPALVVDVDVPGRPARLDRGEDRSGGAA